MALITTAELKTYLGISSSTDDTLIGDLIDAAQVFIENETLRDFEVGADTTRYFTPGKDTHEGTLYFDEMLAQAPTTVTNGDGTVIASTKYVLLDSNRPPYYAMKLKASTGLYWTYQNDPEDAISIVGRWGWSVTPDNGVKQLCKRFTGWLYRSKDAQAYDHTAFSELGVIRVRHRIPEDIQELFTYYRRRS
jgi:hypothetical protein